MLALQIADPDSTSDILEVEALMNALLGLHPGLAGAAAVSHLANGGKRVRARLGLHAAHSLGLHNRAAVAIGAASELLHNASLVHDDIQDGSQIRRGSATVWMDHGRDVAICSGDLMISASFGALASAKSAFLSEALARMHHRISEVIHGQIADLTAKDEADNMLARYSQIAAGKSAPLIALPLELALIMAGLGDHVPKAEQAATAFAIAYQAADDIEDVCEDVANGSVNIVALLEVGMSREAAISAARSLVIESYRQASEQALSLPNRCGELLSAIASDCAKKAQNIAVPA